MKKFDKDDLKKNIKENLNPKNKKKKDSRDELNVTNGQNGLHHQHSSNNSLDRLSPYSRSPMNRSPMGPSPSVSILKFITKKEKIKKDKHIIMTVPNVLHKSNTCLVNWVHVLYRAYFR